MKAQIRRPTARGKAFAMLTLLVSLGGLTHCVLDADDRCDRGQFYDPEYQVCRCEPGLAPAAVGCAPCGEHERLVAHRCECVAGYARAANGGACEPSEAVHPTGQGEACDGDADCAGYEASYCMTVMGNVCLVDECLQVGCSNGWTCCDLQSVGFPDVCVPEGMCPFE